MLCNPGMAGRSEGFTLPELLIAVGISIALSASLLQIYAHAVKLRNDQLHTHMALESSAFLRLILGRELRWALQFPEAVGDLPGIEQRLLCGGRVVDQLRIAPPVQVWAEEAGIDRPSSAIRDSDILILTSPTCETPGRVFYYIARRGSIARNQTGLYRRRARPDSGYFAAEEVVGGIERLQIELCSSVCSPAQKHLQAGELTGVRIHYWATAAHGGASSKQIITIASRRSQLLE